MADAVLVIVQALAVAALLTIVTYVLMFVAVAAWTLRTAPQPDPVTEELDALLGDELEQLLPQILGPAGPGVADR